jgi:hypothetical protein
VFWSSCHFTGTAAGGESGKYARRLDPNGLLKEAEVVTDAPKVGDV